MDVKAKLIKYINEDLERCEVHEIGKVYKYIRTHIVANIPGLKDPVEGGAKLPWFRLLSEGETMEEFDEVYLLGSWSHVPEKYIGQAVLPDSAPIRRPMDFENWKWRIVSKG